jgi:hypothetical protein
LTTNYFVPGRPGTHQSAKQPDLRAIISERNMLEGKVGIQIYFNLNS